MSPPNVPDFDLPPHIRRLFVDGLPERVSRMRAGLAGVAGAADRGAPPSAADLEELFLATHSLKGAAPAFGAYDLAQDAATLSELARRWSSDAVPAPAELARAGDLLERIAAGCRSVARRLTGGAPPAQ